MKVIKCYTIEENLIKYVEKRAQKENRSASYIINNLIQNAKEKESE